MSDITLKEHFGTLIESQKRELDIRFESMETAVALAKEDLLRRLDDLNKLRKEVTDDRAQYVHKISFESFEHEIASWRSDMSDRIARIETRGSTWTVAIGLFFVVLQIALMIFLRK